METPGKIVFRPPIGYSPNTGIKYILQKVIGTSGNDFVYKAGCYTLDSSINASLLPSSYVTLKCVRSETEVVRSLQQERDPNHHNLIAVDTWFIGKWRDGFCVAMPYMYMCEGSLRNIISDRFHKGLTEDHVVIVLKEALQGLCHLHKSKLVHKNFSAGSIYANFKSRPISSVESN